MTLESGGKTPYQRSRQAAIDAARARVLASYQTSGDVQVARTDIGQTARPVETFQTNQPVQVAPAYEAPAQTETTETVEAHAPTQSYGTYQTADAMKDVPVNQEAVNEEWQQYHSAWQKYYQDYYSEYYAQAAQNYLEAEKLKTQRAASGEKQRKVQIKRVLPLVAVAVVIVLFLFLQYNRMIFAPIMAYVSPAGGEVATEIMPVDPSVTQAVSPDPRLIIPKLNVDVPVAFGINYNDVMSAMNHGVAQFMIPGANAMPGEVGNLVISGHSAGDIYSSNPYKFIFSGLERLEVGDLIYINYNSVRYTYQMTKSETVEPSNVAALVYTTTKPMLTLITCTPLGTSRYRLLITAEQISPTDFVTGVDSGIAVDPSDYTMPANEPSLLEQIFGN